MIELSLGVRGLLPHGRWATAMLILLIAALLLRVVAMAAVPLVPEEAYYWMYAQHPSLSYFDHPPMVAWAIGLGTALFGDNEFGVRIVGNLLMMAASVLMYLFGRAWFGRGPGLAAAMALHVLPIYFGVGFVATMDAELLFFWMLCLFGVTIALKHRLPWGWYVAGVALGCAMLSKYTGVFLAAGTLMAVVLHRPWRRHLLTIHPYLAVLIAGAAFCPVVVWNAQHDWASFRFQFVDRFDAGEASLGFVLIFLVYQLITLTPVLLWALVAQGACLLPRWRRLSPRWLIAICFSLPLLALMAQKSMRYEIHINWTSPAFLVLLPALFRSMAMGARRLRASAERERIAGAVAWTATICLIVNLGLLVYLLALQPRVGWISAFGRWSELARIVEDHEDHLQDETGREPLIVAEGKYRLASVLAFYRKPIESGADAAEYTTNQWLFGRRGLGYPYWANREHWTGADCIVVLDNPDDAILAELAGLFESVEPITDARLATIRDGKYRLIIGRKLKPSEPMPSAHAGGSLRNGRAVAREEFGGA